MMSAASRFTIVLLALSLASPASAAPSHHGWQAEVLRRNQHLSHFQRNKRDHGKARTARPSRQSRKFSLRLTQHKGRSSLKAMASAIKPPAQKAAPKADLKKNPKRLPKLTKKQVKKQDKKQDKKTLKLAVKDLVKKTSLRAEKGAAALQKALNKLFVDKKTVHRILENKDSRYVAGVREAFNRKFGHLWKGGSLRGALNKKFWDGGARRVLGALEKGLSRFRVLTTKGREGRLQANIDKVFSLNRQRDTNKGNISESDLVTRHGLTSNNKIELLVDGHQAFKSIFQAMSKATQTIHVSYYIFNDDKLGQAFAKMLMRKAKQGVEVRLMVDGIGSVQMLGSPKRKLMNKLEKAGVEVIRNHIFNPTNRAKKMNHPDHRKLVIVDGKVGFTGGMNVGNHYISEYHDLMVRIEGHSVRQLQTEWVTGWMLLGGRVDKKIKNEGELRKRLFPKVNKRVGTQKIQTVQHIPGENRDILKTYLRQINKARRSIYIENPYMTSHKIQDALVKAAKKGVDVHVILPGQNDHAFSHWAARAKYPKMIDAGVKLYEYPGFNHGKVMVTDGRFVTIGSSNLDDVALYHIYEINVNVHNKRFAAEVMNRVFKKDIAMSKLMKKSQITTFQKAMGRFWNLFAHFI